MLYDKDIREPLFDFLDETYGINRCFEEKMIGNSRADIVMVTKDALFGIEIKSDADTYTRLKRQIKDYDKFYDYNLIVCGGSHGNSVIEHVPKHWGIITVDEEEDGTCDFYFLRQPLKNPNASMVCKLSTLWRPELVILQENLGLPKYANLGKARLITRIADMRSEDEFQSEVCNALLERDYTTIGDIFRKKRTSVRVSIRRKRKTSKKI